MLPALAVTVYGIVGVNGDPPDCMADSQLPVVVAVVVTRLLGERSSEADVPGVTEKSSVPGKALPTCTLTLIYCGESMAFGS
jgi:hypothetical protein